MLGYEIDLCILLGRICEVRGLGLCEPQGERQLSEIMVSSSPQQLSKTYNKKSELADPGIT